MYLKAKSEAIKKLLKNAVKSEMPGYIIPMHFKIASATFDHEDWLFEIKWDGFRLLSYNRQEQFELRSKTNKPFDKQFWVIKQQLETRNLNAIPDGELVILDDDYNLMDLPFEI
jgi:bifunctional non-homologous end joining protein LigD